jgi:hypothetical protein
MVEDLAILGGEGNNIFGVNRSRLWKAIHNLGDGDGWCSTVLWIRNFFCQIHNSCLNSDDVKKWGERDMWDSQGIWRQYILGKKNRNKLKFIFMIQSAADLVKLVIKMRQAEQCGDGKQGGWMVAQMDSGGSASRGKIGQHGGLPR